MGPFPGAVIVLLIVVLVTAALTDAELVLVTAAGGVTKLMAPEDVLVTTAAPAMPDGHAVLLPFSKSSQSMTADEVLLRNNAEVVTVGLTAGGVSKFRVVDDVVLPAAAPGMPDGHAVLLPFSKSSQNIVGSAEVAFANSTGMMVGLAGGGVTKLTAADDDDVVAAAAPTGAEPLLKVTPESGVVVTGDAGMVLIGMDVAGANADERLPGAADDSTELYAAGCSLCDMQDSTICQMLTLETEIWTRMSLTVLSRTIRCVEACVSHVCSIEAIVVLNIAAPLHGRVQIHECSAINSIRSERVTRVGDGRKRAA